MAITAETVRDWLTLYSLEGQVALHRINLLLARLAEAKVEGVDFTESQKTAIRNAYAGAKAALAAALGHLP